MKIQSVRANNRRKAFEIEAAGGRELDFPYARLKVKPSVKNRVSASQFYRLLDQTNYTKSAGQMLSLLHILGCEVDVVVRKRGGRRTA